MPTPTMLDPAFRINTSHLGGQQSPAIAGLSDGRFVAVWEDAVPNQGTLKYAMFNADGSVAPSAASLDEAVANLDTTGTIARGDVAIAALTGGGFAITWAPRLPAVPTPQWDIFHRVFFANGLSANFPDVLSNTGDTLHDQRQPDIAGDGAGGFYVVWQDGLNDTTAPNIKLAHFDASGQPTGAAIGLSDAIGGDQFPQIAVNRAGTQYVVVWDDDLGITQGGNEDGIYGSISGGAEFRIDHGPFHEFNSSPDVAYSTGNNFMVVWTKFISSGVYEVEGAINGGAEFKINTTGQNDNSMPSVVGLQSGDFLVVWLDNKFDGDGYHVLGQLLGVDGTPIGSEFAVTDFSGVDIERIKASEMLDGRVLVTWDPNKGGHTDGIDVFARFVDPRQTGATWTGTSVSEQFVGTAFDDILNGAGGNDILWGKGGTNNQMTGGPGNDTFHVDNAGDQVFEAALQGNDTVLTSVSYFLTAGQEIESLLAASLAGTGAMSLYGNEFGQRIDGNNGANTLYGNAGNDVLNGNGGNDILYGGPGTDVLRGGLGNDTYVLENSSDSVSDTGGVDTVTSTINRSLLTAGLTTIENLTFANVSSALIGTGNNLANVITGNNYNNTLTGGVGNDNLRGNSGNDTLIGGPGVDTETGGAGNDFFVFNAPLSAANRDVIVDFSHAADTFRLENSKMPALGAAGALNPAFFFAGTAAHDANDHIVYNHVNGALYYDSNGNAAGGSVLLATLSNKPVLAANDFVVI